MSAGESGWIPLVQWTIWGIVMAFVMGLLAKSRLRARPMVEARHLEHPRSTLTVGLICFIFFTALAVVSNIFPNQSASWWTSAIFLGFAVLALPLVVDYFRSRHEVSEDGLSYGRFFGPRRHLQWSDLRNVTYAPAMKWFRLETQSGEVARISVMLMGLPEFARMIIANAPPESIEASALEVLKEMAVGNPPPILG